MLGQGLDASVAYEEVCKLAGFPQAGSWVLGTLGGLVAGRYGLGPILEAPMDAMVPNNVATPDMTRDVGNVTGAFVGGNLGGTLGYMASGQRPFDPSPGGILRGAAGMTPTGAFDHPDEIPTWRNLRRKTAGIGAGLRSDMRGLANAVPGFATWLIPTVAGTLGGTVLGSELGEQFGASHLGAETNELLDQPPVSDPETWSAAGQSAGSLLGGVGGAALGYKMNETAKAPDVTPFGITSVAAGVPVHGDQPNIDLLSGSNRPKVAELEVPATG